VAQAPCGLIAEYHHDVIFSYHVGMIRTQVQLRAEQLRALKRLAAERNVSVSALVRQGVDVVVGAKYTEGRIRRALGAVGKFSNKGLTDTSTRHDEYLDDAYSS